MAPSVRAGSGDDPGVAPVADSQRATRRRVLRLLLESGALTAAELAERLHVTAAAVRRHLDVLLAEGDVAARDRRGAAPRGRGRPAREFHLTDRGRSAFAHGYDDLAAGALRFLAAHAGREAVQAFAQERLASLRQQVAARGGSTDVEDLARALSGSGYAASTRSTGGGGVQLCQHHCPVAHVAEEFPELCAAETALFSELLGTHVQRLATIAHGDGVCTTHVPAAPAPRPRAAHDPPADVPTPTPTPTPTLRRASR